VVVPILAIVAVAVSAGGYWFARTELALPWSGSASAPTAETVRGQHNQPATPSAAVTSKARKILYYKDPMGRPDFSPVPKTDEMGMDYIPVYEHAEAPLEPAPLAPSSARSHDHTAHSSAPAGADRKILYYRNPMGLPDTSPVPKKDSMGMDYIPVYADEAEDDASLVKISPARVQMLGVQTEPATLRTLIRPVRAVGAVEFSERQQAIVSTKFEGWVERLYVNATGEPVRRGAALMRVYSPILVQTQQEYVDAAAMADSLAGAYAESAMTAARLVEGARLRLRYLDFPEAELRRLERERRASRTVVWPAPFSGIVLEKTVFEGMRFMPGDPLYKIAGVSPIWVIAEVFEQDLGLVAVGQPATITVKAYPGRTFGGRVAFIYPTVSEATRTGRVRIEIPNPAGELKADMYASVELDARASASAVLTVPDSAVIDNGDRQVVLIERGAGRYQPRRVEIGARAEGYTEILDGLAVDERVVVSANFLIDAESNLKAALGAFTAGEHQH
jgi:Cu(I)/Ag(I) efflux system membrane fusion protein